MIRWTFILPINPEPWAIGPVGYTNKGGKPRGFVGENKQLRIYQDAVRQMLKERISAIENGDKHFPLAGPCELSLWFWRRLDSYELSSGKKSNRHWADATNMQKALEDAIQGVLTGNDKNNLKVMSEIVHQAEEINPGIVIQVTAARAFNPNDMGMETFLSATQIFADADRFEFDNNI